MKKQKFSVGERISFIVYSGKHKGTIIFANDNYIIVTCDKQNVPYSLYNNSHNEVYKVKRLVKKKKPAPVAKARTWWLVSGNCGDMEYVFRMKEHATSFSRGMYGKHNEAKIVKVREVLGDE